MKSAMELSFGTKLPLASNLLLVVVIISSSFPEWFVT